MAAESASIPSAVLPSLDAFTGARDLDLDIGYVCRNWTQQLVSSSQVSWASLQLPTI